MPPPTGSLLSPPAALLREKATSPLIGSLRRRLYLPPRSSGPAFHAAEKFEKLLKVGDGLPEKDVEGLPSQPPSEVVDLAPDAPRLVGAGSPFPSLLLVDKFTLAQVNPSGSVPSGRAFWARTAAPGSR